MSEISTGKGINLAHMFADEMQLARKNIAARCCLGLQHLKKMA